MAVELTEAELAMAQSFGLSPEQYAAYRTTEGAREWERARADRSERDRIKQAVREALAERDGQAA